VEHICNPAFGDKGRGIGQISEIEHNKVLSQNSQERERETEGRREGERKRDREKE
jgi:hypothetical protein